MILNISQDMHDLILNYMSEIVVGITFAILMFVWKFLRNLSLKRIFGCDIIKNFKLIYASFILGPLPANWEFGRFPYQKSDGLTRASIENPVSLCETRAIKYLVSVFSNRIKYSPEIVSDEEFNGIHDMSFCSLGAYTNYKSRDVINSPRNSFYGFINNYSSIINLQTHQQYLINNEYDYAIILKLKSQVNNRKTQMCISGIGEWGTSGGAYYLSKHWSKVFRKTLFNSEFGLLIRVRRHSDDSAELIEIVKKRANISDVFEEIWNQIACVLKKDR